MEHYLYPRKFSHAPSQPYLHFWDWYMEAPIEKEKVSTLRINETIQLLYNAKCNMYIPNVLYFSGNLFTNFTIWSKISPVPILICFTYNKAPGLLIFHANIIVTIFVACPPNAQIRYYKSKRKEGLLNVGKAKRNNCLLRVYIDKTIKNWKYVTIRCHLMQEQTTLHT